MSGREWLVADESTEREREDDDDGDEALILTERITFSQPEDMADRCFLMLTDRHTYLFNQQIQFQREGAKNEWYRIGGLSKPEETGLDTSKNDQQSSEKQHVISLSAVSRFLFATVTCLSSRWENYRYWRQLHSVDVTSNTVVD